MLFQAIVVAAATVSVLLSGCDALLCACNTGACREQGLTTCNATAMCYVQYLDLGDGNDPLVRGCIASKTPLLCENRRPAMALSWPVLACCANAPMCNKDAVPGNLPSTTAATPAERPSTPQPRSTAATWNDQQPLQPLDAVGQHQQGSKNSLDQGRQTSLQSSSPSHPPEGGTGSGLSATYAALLAVACSLLVLVAGALTLFLLRRRALASGHYGAMHGGYLKGHHPPRDCADAEAPHSGLCAKRLPTSVPS